MNQLEATVKSIEQEGLLHMLQLDMHDSALYMVSLEPPQNVEVGKRVVLSFKSTSVSIAKNLDECCMLSYINLIRAKIVTITKGRLLCSVVLDAYGHQVESIISAIACDKMELQTTQEVTLLIKASEIAIKEVL